MEIQYDKSVVVIPKHLNLEFFDEVIENAIQEANPQLRKIFIKMVVDHALDEKRISIIVKSMPVTKSVDVLDDMKVFLKETIFYYHILPTMEVLTNYQRQFSAKIYALNSIKCKCQKGDFQVLNHGDMWAKLSASLDVIFVDYQMSIWSSPGIDLNYFFNTSLPLKLLTEKRETFIEIYYAELKKCLSELHYNKVPTFQQIRQEVKKRELFGFFANDAIYPIISIDKNISDDSTFENFADQEFAKKKFKQIMEQQKLKDMYAYTLLYFNEMKVVD